MTTVTTETWMPVSGAFKAYPLDPVCWVWEIESLIWSKGHHDPATFLVAAAHEWAADNDSSMVLWEDNPGHSILHALEGPVWPPARLRDPGAVRHEWWANRMNAQVLADGYSYSVETGGPARPGAYPVTVVYY